MAYATELSEAFDAELQQGDVVRMALAIARIDNPDLAVEATLLLLDEMAAQIAPKVAEADAGGTRALAFMQAVRLDLGLRGNSERYYDASNSYLPVVLERRTGLPIMLSLVMVALGQRLGLRVDGVGFPGHFMARYEDEEGVWFLDPFHGAVMTADDVPGYFLKLFGHHTMSMNESYFGPFPVEAWAQRILNNLHAVYLTANDLERLAHLLPLMLVLEPERQELWQQLGLVAYRRGDLTQAVRALRRYFFLHGHLSLSAPNSDLAPAPPVLDEPARQLWNLLEEIESARTRWN